VISCAALVVVFAAPCTLASANSRSKEIRVALVVGDGVKLYARPSIRAHVLSTLVQQTQVELIRRRAAWVEVRIWASVDGWLLKKDVVTRAPWPSASHYQAPRLHIRIRPVAPRALQQQAMTVGPVALSDSAGSAPRRYLSSGSRVTVDAWQQDHLGRIWYRIGAMWSPGDRIQFVEPNPGRMQYNGRYLWARVRGKGMWLTLGTAGITDPAALVAAALHDGITHFYVESAISPLGFHGRAAVGPLIDAAHRAHRKVIAWMYPYLYDIGSDVELTRELAAYRTASGQGFDGIASDLEQNISVTTVRSYSQLVRAYVGPSYFLAGVTYSPQSWPAYPFAEVAHDYNVIEPMDYWHETKTESGLFYDGMPYGFNYASRYAQDSVRAIRRVSQGVPVAPIGQSFDDFGRLEMGPFAPSGAEISGFLAGSKASGAVGASLFQWMTATDEEWRAILEFRY
jgi:hypothetical protein